MCGIAGILGGERLLRPDTVARMVEIIHHRGPDATGVKPFPGAVLGHKRLSIIDLSERGLQPMQSRDGRHALVFNGEIYNYRELRRELEPSHDFQSDSDTEVLLAAWRHWGEAALERLNGMFAFCVYDLEDRTAFFARDRFGQKPLFFAEREGSLLFASEVKALIAAGVPAAPDVDVWARYLLKATYDDTRESFFDGVWQLLPGECATYVPGRGLTQRHYYWLPDQIARREPTLAEAADQTRELMVDACRIHMRADVPVGIMLSGGLDSATILAALDLGGELNPSVKCFSVEFGPSLTERPWIEAAATYHGLPSRIDEFTQEAFRASIAPMMWHLEAPIGGLMNCALDVVMKAAREDGFIVLQDGTGPDEAFGGYRNHHNQFLAELIASGHPDAGKALEEYAANWECGVDDARRAAEVEIGRSGTAIDGTVPVRPDLLTADIAGRPVAPSFERFASGSRMLSSLMDYVQGSKVPRNLRMLDRLSMAYGLELRLPFLDHRLIELGLSLPPGYLFWEGRTKGIVREGFRGRMDGGVRLATKRSIQAPQAAWLAAEPMRSYVGDLIGSASFASRRFFDVTKVKAAWDEFCRGGIDNSFFVWQWINVEEWFRCFVDHNATAEPRPLCHELHPEAARARTA